MEKGHKKGFFDGNPLIYSITYLSSCGPSTVAPLRGAAVPASCAGDGLAEPDRNWRRYWTAVALRSWRSRTDWEASVRLSLTTLVVRLNKRYFIIDQQIARHFVHYSECLSNPPSLYATQMINPFLNSRIKDNHNKGLL